MRARRITPSELAAAEPHQLVGAVLLSAVALGRERLAKGRVVDDAAAAALIDSARQGTLDAALRLVWPEEDDLHEDTAAEQLALAVGGAGVDLRPPRLSRIDLAAKWDGVLYVQVNTLRRLNEFDPIEVFTLFHGQSVRRGESVASVKVAPHVVPASAVRAATRIVQDEGPPIEVRPYRDVEVPVIIAEPITTEQRLRFEEGAGAKLAAMGARLGAIHDAYDRDPARSVARARAALQEVALSQAAPVVLVTGVSPGDPLAPFADALEGMGGRFVRRGVPAHPGSMLWLATVEGTQFLGLPQCGMFSLATAADLVLPRLLTGETLTPTQLAELAHGGLLTRDMRFRMPPYARTLEPPDE